jgi:hypothetical protein
MQGGGDGRAGKECSLNEGGQVIANKIMRFDRERGRYHVVGGKRGCYMQRMSIEDAWAGCES